MCKGTVVLLGAAVLCATPLAAQEDAARLVQMRSRLDSMRAALAQADSIAALVAASDTVVAGGLRISTSRTLRPMVEPAAAEAWNRLLDRFGPALADGGGLPVVQFGVARSVIPKRLDVSELARGLERAAAQAVWQRQDARLLDWLRSGYPAEPLVVERVAGIAEKLAAMPARPNPACLHGMLPACAVALGLRLGADTLAEWYEPATWPRLASTVPGLYGPIALTRDQCVDGSDLMACRSLLSPERVPTPVGEDGRRYLVELALAAGGDGAFGRLTGDTAASIEHRLADASGIPIDTLLGHWIATVYTAGRRGRSPGGGETLLIFGWSAVVLMLAVRGSRWRLASGHSGASLPWQSASHSSWWPSG